MVTKTKNRRRALDFANHEVVVLAAYLSGGRFRYVDTEDIAVKANEIAPGRFTWKKYKSQINIELVRVFLSDAKKIVHGEYLGGSGKEGWLLTEAGVDFAEAHLRHLDAEDFSRERADPKEKAWKNRERQRLLADDAYRRFSTDGLESVTEQDAERFFRIDDYVVGAARRRKLQRFLNVFRSDPQLGAAILAIAGKVRKK